MHFSLQSIKKNGRSFVAEMVRGNTRKSQRVTTDGARLSNICYSFTAHSTKASSAGRAAGASGWLTMPTTT